ncbi:MAG: ABC transporter ATP-binding protein [Bacillota bacterium]
MNKDLPLSKWQVVKRMLRGHRLGLLLSVLFLGAGIVAAYAGPLVIGFTVDYVIGSAESSLPAWAMQWLEALGGREFLRSNIYLCALALVAFTFVNGLATFLRRYLITRSTEGMVKKLRDNLFWHLQNVPYDYYKHVSTGDLVQRCTSDVDTIRRFISLQLLEVVRALVMATVAASVLFSLDRSLAAISLSLMPVLTVTSYVYFKKVRKFYTDADEAEGAMSAAIQENLTGMRVVRAFGQQQAEVENFTACNRDHRDKTYRLIRLNSYFWGASDTLAFLQIGLSLVVGVYFTVARGMSLGTLWVFFSYTRMLVWPLRHLGRVLADMGKASVALGRIAEIFAQPVEVEPGLALEPEIRGHIQFKNVCFGYDRYDDVLRDISFSVQPGQTVAILGATGSGKTSLVQLLQRLYPVTAGEIIIDGVNINDIARGHLRRNIGIVLQEPFLYSRTIKENIRIARPQAPDEDVYKMARVAAVHDVIQSFENGYDTVVGERGITLSGGQRQRVAIARMLMQKAPILIFDDSLSAVDTETDAAIRAALRMRRENTATFIISHRITTLCEADTILVLEKGRLVQQGTHQELLEQEGLYRRIAEIQNALEDELHTEGGEG